MLNPPNISSFVNTANNSYINIGQKIKTHGNRVLFICSDNNSSKIAVNLIKKNLVISELTFIQYDQIKTNLNRESIEVLIQRAKDFKVMSIISLGEYSERMAGRFVAQSLGLPYYEFPTSILTPYIFSRHTIIPNKLKNDYNLIEISRDTITEIICDQTLYLFPTDKEKTLSIMMLLLDLSQIFLSSTSNRISKTESKNLFNRILVSLESESITDELSFDYGLTTSLYQGISNTDLSLSIISRLLGSRFNTNPHMIGTNLIPWFLDEKGEHDLANRVRELLTSLNISTRLKSLGITIEHLKDIPNTLDIFPVIEKAY